MTAPALGIDVGGTTTKACLTDAGGRRLADTTAPTPRSVDGLAAAVAGHVAWARRTAGDLAGIGVVVPGIVDEPTGTAVYSVNLGWRDVPMRRLLSQAVGTGIAFGHDVRAGALAEARWGAGAPDMLYVAIGTGIAATAVLGGTPVVTGGYAGEVGQLLVTDPATGRAARLEEVSSAAALARRYAERRAPGGGAQDGGDGARGVVERARAGDDVALAVLDEAVSALSEVLATAVGVLGLVPIVIGGGLAGAGEMLLDRLRAGIAHRLPLTPAPRVVPATLGPWSQALGAAAMGLDLAGCA